MENLTFERSSQYEHWLKFVREHRISTTGVSDVLDSLGIVLTLPSQIALRNSSRDSLPVFGQAYTVSWLPVRKQKSIHSSGPSTWKQVRDFLCPSLEDGHGLIYVGGAGSLVTEGALAGGMSCTYFQEGLKFCGVILGGAVRDSSVVEALRMPVFATNFIPIDTQGAWLSCDAGGSCVIDNVRINSGDWILADLNGVVVIPHAHLEEVLERARQTEEDETSTLTRVRAGESLVRLIESGSHI